MDEEEPVYETDADVEDQLILLAASHHDIETLRTLLRKGSASVQDPETGFTPLHAAIAACEDAEPNPSAPEDSRTANGEAEAKADGSKEEATVKTAARTMKLLLMKGAIWNDVDQRNETPGCLALRLGLKEPYDIMVDAGVRAEILLSRLDEYEQLAEEDEDEEGEEEVVDGIVETVPFTTDSTATQSQSSIDQTPQQQHAQQQQRLQQTQRQQQAQAASEAATTSGQPASQPPGTSQPPKEADLENDAYLQSSLRFQDGRILDDANNGVMMAWETDIMRRTADRLTPRSGLRILNIGHGMGIIDSFFQETYPKAHHIIEAHPAVIARMKKDGWDDKEGVTIHEGRWQEVVPKLFEEDGGTLFDAIYFDTFAEDYKALRDFFSDSVIGLLDDGGKWGFFNGMGADRQICYDVYGKVVEMDLFEAGFDTVWETVEVEKTENEEWTGVKRAYWVLKEYRLPVCTFIG